MVLLGCVAEPACADEGGVSYWLPGRFSSLAAVPGVPGWSMAAVYYHTTVSASGATAAAKEIQIGRFPATVNSSLNLHLNAQGDLVLLNPTYTFATPVLGGQLAIGIADGMGALIESLSSVNVLTLLGIIFAFLSGFALIKLSEWMKKTRTEKKGSLV